MRSAEYKSLINSHVSLKKYVNKMFSILEKNTDSKTTALEKVTEAKAASLNIQHQQLIKDVAILRESKANLEGKASQESVNKITETANRSRIIAIIGIIIGIIGIILSIIAMYLKK
jgi:hypothetical protein